MAFYCDSYKITGRGSGAGQHQSPKTWTFQGSTDNISWDTLDTVTNETGWIDFEERTFAVDSPGTYRYYRLRITEVQMPFPYVCTIAELKLFNGAVNQCAVMTANNAPSPSVCWANNELGAYYAWYAFDGVNNNDSLIWVSQNDSDIKILGYEDGIDASTTYTKTETSKAYVGKYEITRTYPTEDAWVQTPIYFRWEIPSI